MLTTPVFNPTDPAFVAEPYLFYRELREKDPIHHEALLPGWLISRHADVAALMGDPRLINPRQSDIMIGRRASHEPRPMSGYAAVLDDTVLFADPPLHGPQRSAVRHALRTIMPELLVTHTEQVIDEIAHNIAGESHVEFMSRVARPLMTTLTLRLLGAPARDSDRVTQWVFQSLESAASAVYGRSPATDLVQLDEAATALTNYAAELAERKRREPGEDLATALVTAFDSTEGVNRAAAAMDIVLMLVAAIPKGSYFLGNSVLSLTRHPEQLRDLRENPDIIDSALEELLRFESPVQIAVPQLVADDIEFNGHHLRRREWVYLLLGSANRDPAVFDDPDRLDLRRPAKRHVAFGVGPHTCLGPTLIRIIGREVLTHLLRHFPRLALSPDHPEPAFHPVPYIRSLAHLHLDLAR
jgi:cytochrome P450